MHVRCPSTRCLLLRSVLGAPSNSRSKEPMFSSRVMFVPLALCTNLWQTWRKSTSKTSKYVLGKSHTSLLQGSKFAPARQRVEPANSVNENTRRCPHKACRSPLTLNHLGVSETKLWGVGGGGAGCKNVAFLDLPCCCPSCPARLCQVGQLVLLALRHCQEPLAHLWTPLGCPLQTCPASTLQSSSPSLWLGDVTQAPPSCCTPTAEL